MSYMKKAVAILACFLLLAACAAPQARGPSGLRCRWPVEPVVLRQVADTVFLSWSYRADQLPEQAILSDLPALSAFRDTIRLKTGTLDARSLLDRQIAFYSSRPDSDSQGEAANGRLVRAGSVGTLRPVGCAEALMVEYQARRFPMASRPTEFQAVMMQRDEPGNRQVRIYFAASSAPWPPKADLLFEHVAADRREGWRAVAHIHNHPFLFASQGDIAGANAPSLTDVQFWRYLRDSIGVESARVTNGITTFEAPAAAFERLHARADNQ
jgi:hypothetical protein